MLGHPYLDAAQRIPPPYLPKWLHTPFRPPDPAHHLRDPICRANSSPCSPSFQFANGTYGDLSSNRAPPTPPMFPLSFFCCMPTCAMACPFHYRCSLLVFVVLLLSTFSAAQENCNTQANPYCAGDARFANICCPSPSACYFRDRLGTPACCSAGQICINNGQSNPPPAIATVAPNSAVSLVSGLGPITASLNILTTNSLPLTTPVAAFSTVGGLLVGAARPIARAKEATPALLPLVLMMWDIF